MKIVKKLGERLPPWLHTEVRPILTFTGTGAALLHGSADLIVSGWLWLGEHLGWRERLGAIAAGGYLAVYGCAHAPHVVPFAIPAAVVAWCVAAWWHAPPTGPQETAKAAESEAPAAAPQDVYEATLGWIRERIGDTQGVHLRDLLAHAQAHGMFEGLDVSELRTHLERWGIPVRDRVRVRGLGVTVGVYRPDLPAPPEPLPEPNGQDPPDSELHAV